MGKKVIKDNPETNSLRFLSPMSLIKAARQAHPAFKYAIAAAGIASLVAVVTRYGASPATLVFGAIILVVLMVLFLVFSQAVVVARKKLSIPSLVLVWSFLFLSILTALFLFTSAFFNSPLPVRSFLIRQLSFDDRQASPNQDMFGVPYTGKVLTHENGVDVTHQVSLKLSISGEVITGEYTNDAGDAGMISGTLSGNSLDLKLISSKVTGECKLQGRLSSDRSKLSAIYKCDDGEYAEV
jgi:hypothetical protein